MVEEIIWTYEAAIDLENIANYISRDSEFYAATFVQKIIQQSRSLKQFPQIGRVVPEIKNRLIRELFINEYRLIYKIEKARIIILGIVHGKRDLQKFWKNR